MAPRAHTRGSRGDVVLISRLDSLVVQAEFRVKVFRFNPSWTIWRGLLRCWFWLKRQVITLWNLCPVHGDLCAVGTPHRQFPGSGSRP